MYGRLFVILVDTNTKQQFLVDTDADVSVFPKSLINKRISKTKYELFAANNSIVLLYGNITKTVNIGLRQNFARKFVNKAIIDSDFLKTMDF